MDLPLQIDILPFWLYWHFVKIPRGIIEAWKNFLWFDLNYFSVPLTLKTFFSPWRKYSWVYPRGFEISTYLEVFLSNLISRLLGAFVRSFVLVAAFLLEIIVFLGGAAILFLWIISPLLFIILFLFSLKGF